MCVFTSLTNAQNKYALLIGVSKYPANDSKKQFWGDLSSDKDLDLLKKTLPKQGFSLDHIFTLENENVTPKGVEKAVENLCQQITAGDIVILHFSGHGQQITDLDLAEDDGFDEAFVCYNAPTIYYEGYKGEDHLSDDKINVLISKIRKKLGPNGHLLVLFDSCHSGNMTRGGNDLTRRGGEEKIILPEEIIKTQGAKNLSEGHSDWFNSVEDGIELSSLCAISGCLPGEFNYEVFDKSFVKYGSLTYAFCEVMKQPGVEKMNYQDLSHKLKQIIQNKLKESHQSQHPVAEGNLNTLFLSGKALGIKPYFEISEIVMDTIKVDAGLLNNLNLGDSLCFKNSSGKILAKGEIGLIDATQSDVRIPKINSILNLAESNYTAEVWSRNLTADFITLYLKGTNKRHIASVRDSLSNLYGYEFVDDSLKAKLILNVSKDKTLSCYQVNMPNVFIRKIQNQPYESFSAVKKELEAYFLIERFSKLDIKGNNGANVTFRRFAAIVPNRDEVNTICIDPKLGYTHELEWNKGVPGMMNEKDLIQVNIQTKEPTFMVILNILNGEITTKTEKLTARPLKQNEPNIFWIQVDKGDLKKIMISDKPFDLSNAPAVIQGKSNLPKERGEKDASYLLFPKTNSTRGGNQAISIYNFNIEID